jgi:hypothetical protein
MANGPLSIGRVGFKTATDGNEESLRLSRNAELVTQDARGRFHESASRGALFHVSTAVAGVAPGTALSTTPPMALWNPPNSGVLLSLQQVFLGYVSGTLGAGSLVHALVIGQTTLPSGGAELTPQCGLLANIRGKGRAFQGSTLVGTPSILRPSMILGAGLATTAELPDAPAYDEVDGSIVVPPGAVWAFQGVAAGGTSPLVLIGAIFEEVAIP